MKYTLSILYTILLFSYQSAFSAEDPIPFEKFFKQTMKVTPGTFPVYQEGAKYYLEIPASSLNKDVLVLGDVAKGFANYIAQSSGIIRFNQGFGNVLNVTREVYKEEASPDFNQGIEELVQKSNLTPVSYVLPVAAKGKDNTSYIVDITKQLMEGGELFSFKNLSDINNSDPLRSGVQQVKSAANGVVFTVLRTQTVPGNSVNGSKAIDRAVSYVVNLVIQQLPPSTVKVKEADKRIGFGTVSFNDFGKSPYGVKTVDVITKWNLSVRPSDQKKYEAGQLVNPLQPISVFIDKSMPSLFIPYVKQAIAQWNIAFNAAGFKQAIVVADNEEDNWLSAGKIQIKWGNANSKVVNNLISDPRTGEILAAKMNISDNVINEQLPSYFAKCGLSDPRILKDLYNPEVRGEIVRWKVAQAMGELLGMVPNLYGSAAYSTKQIRSASWLKRYGFTSSITDGVDFNFVVQPEDNVPVSELMPRVGAYDVMAIGWAYRVFSNRDEEKKALASLKYSNAALFFLEEGKTDPYTRNGDLASDQLEASELGMKNIVNAYPKLEEISKSMKGKDEDWSNFKLLSGAFQKSYQLYSDNVSGYIGGLSLRPVLKNYNEVPVVFIPKKDQQKAMLLLSKWFFNGVPYWMENRKMNFLNNESEELKMQNSTLDLFKKLLNASTLGNLIRAEYALGKEAYTTNDLLTDLHHYVMKDFNDIAPLNAYTKLMQGNFILALADAAAKDNFTSGLTDSNEVIHFYLVNTLERVNQLAEKHKDPDAKAFYQMLAQKVQRVMNQKKS